VWSSSQLVLSVVAKSGITCFFTPSAANAPPAAQRTPASRHIERSLDHGVVLGNPRLEQARGQAVASLKADALAFARNVAPIIAEIERSGVKSARAIAKALDARGVATPRGGAWSGVQVEAIKSRAQGTQG
jgi:hypothetical protein